jgi:hypothetical protein
MTGFPTFKLSHLLLVFTGMALFLGFARMSLNSISVERWRVHPSEQHIADYIRQLGGHYATDANNKRRIRYVSLDDTAATDRDIEVVLQLQFIERLDVRNSRVTDASLVTILKHPQLRYINVKGSAISTAALEKLDESAVGRSFDEWYEN